MATRTQEHSDEGGQSDKGAPEHRSQIDNFWRNFSQNFLSLVGGVIVLCVVLIAIFAPVLSLHGPLQQFKSSLASPIHNPVPPLTTYQTSTGESVFFLLGTDNLGRSILSRALFGTRVMLESSIAIIAFALFFGLPIGAISGYYANTKIDEALMRLMDLVLSFPSLILAIAVIGAFGTETFQVGPIPITNQVKVILVVGIVYVPRLARVMRGSVMSEMEEDYIDAAEAAGADNVYILTREILPNTLSPVIVQASLSMATAILSVAGLSFLGVGIQPPTPSLGLMLSSSRDYVYSGAWWFSIVPGFMILITIFGFNLLGDGLRDALDPKYDERQQE